MLEKAHHLVFAKRILTGGDQGTKEKYKLFPGYEKLSAALKRLGDFDLPKAAATVAANPTQS